MKTIAVIATAYFKNSHADVIMTRWLDPPTTDIEWGRRTPNMTIASAYIEQTPDTDIGVDICKKHNVPLYDTVAEALCLGGDKLAVDAVILIGEHGDYPDNEFGQKLYPRKELFDKIVDVYRKSGRVAPLFCDKHLSWNYDWAFEMHNTARDMGFMLMSSSTIPLCDRVPDIKLPLAGRIIDAVAPFYGGDEVYGYHSYEFVQPILEARPGGETGIARITCFRDEDVWKQQEQGTWPATLTDAALRAIKAQDPEKIPDMDVRKHVKPAEQDKVVAAFHIECVDGTKVTHINLQGAIRNWAIAMNIEGQSEPVACAPYVGDTPNFHGHFARMSQLIEDAFLSGKPPFDARRSLITAGLTAASMHARMQPGTPLDTPHLHIAY
jgi:hypothetical protein